MHDKEGGSIGSSSRGEEKSEIADYYGLRNRIIFTRKFYPKCLLSVCLGFLIAILNRLKRKKIKVLFEMLKRNKNK